MELKTNNMTYIMKGSPMQRNFGVGTSPAKNRGTHKHTDEADTKHPISKAMKDKVKAVKAQNLKETNELLASQGKEPVEGIKESSDKASPARAGILSGGFGLPNPGAGLASHWDDTMGAYFKGRKARKKEEK